MMNDLLQAMKDLNFALQVIETDLHIYNIRKEIESDNRRFEERAAESRRRFEGCATGRTILDLMKSL